MQELKSKYFIVIWSEGYPEKISAVIEKNKLLGALFADCNCDYAFTSKMFYPNWKQHQTDKNIYFNTRKNSIFSYLLAIINEIKHLKKLKRKYSKVFLLASYTNFFVYFTYSIMCRLYSVKLILSIMEWHISQFENKNIIKKTNPFLFDNLAFRVSNGAISISDFIYYNLQKQCVSKKILKIPVLTDITEIDSIEIKPIFKNNYFVYCGSVGYIEVIELIIESFEIFSNHCKDKKYDLILILNGKPNEIEKLKRNVHNLKNKNEIYILSKIQFNELIGIYKNAEILIIPLRNNDQDKARYPHKIGEYSICSKPIISNNIGQVGIDFEHKKNIFFSEDFTSNSLAQSLIILSKDMELRNKLSYNARLNGEKLFNKNNYILITQKFLNNI
jgi:glycosyltransferase involved in cell wall biosynthesis